MSLDHFPLRFQHTDRPYNDTLVPSWSCPSKATPPNSDHFPSASWNQNLYPAWSASPSASLSYYRHSPSSSFHHHSAYPDSPPRSNHPSIAGSISPPPAHNHIASFASPLNQPWSDNIYTLHSPAHTHSEPPPSSSAATSPSARASSISSASVPHVKLEHDENPGSDCFVMEFSASTPAAQASSSLAPPTEVPLRATQASKAMRKMMGVFRLNPFTMHESSGQPATTWTGEDPGPLEEEPQIFEFQLDLPGCETTSPDSARIRSDSPDNLHGVDLHESPSWSEPNHPSSHYSSLSHPTWLANEPSQSYPLPSLRPYSPHLSQSPSLSSTSPRRTPLDTSDYSTGYTLPAHQPIDNIPSISSMARRWSNPTNIQAPFMI